MVKNDFGNRLSLNAATMTLGHFERPLVNGRTIVSQLNVDSCGT
jgi:hypothetical protein